MQLRKPCWPADRQVLDTRAKRLNDAAIERSEKARADLRILEEATIETTRTFPAMLIHAGVSAATASRFRALTTRGLTTKTESYANSGDTRSTPLTQTDAAG